jgi:hypothetical protein
MDIDQKNTLLDQIGRITFLAVSGGRGYLVDGTLVLPVGAGYTVEVEYVEGRDTYTVRRVFNRAGKKFPKGELTDVYMDEISERVWEAHAFRSYDFPKGANA